MLTLHISGNDEISTSKLVEFFRRHEIETTLIETLSSIKLSDGSFVTEKGVQVRMYKCDQNRFKEVWQVLKCEFNIKCGHIVEQNLGFSGCTENYIRDSECPNRSNL